MSWQHFFVIIA